MSEEMVEIKGKLYPKWAVEKAKLAVEKRGGTLEGALAGILLFDEAKRKAKQVDPSAPGMGHSHHIGGYVILKKSAEVDLDDLIEMLNKDTEEMYKAIEDETPTHPTLGETGTFVRLVYGHPLYRTASGKEFFVTQDFVDKEESDE